MTKHKAICAATAVLLSVITPGAGHYWLGGDKKMLLIPASILLLVGMFCWSGLIFIEGSFSWLALSLAGLYLGILVWAGVMGWNEWQQPKAQSGIVMVIPAILLVLTLGVKYKDIIYGVQLFYIPSQSMEPVLNVGDLVVVDVRKQTLNKAKNGDILVFNRPGESEFYIKRLIAKPGDKLEMFAGQISVNDELKLSNLPSLNESVTTLSQDSYFVMGDNYHKSFDSRHWGLVKRARLIGVYQYTLHSLSLD